MNKTTRFTQGLFLAAVTTAASSNGQTFDLTFTDDNSVVQGYGQVTAAPNGNGTFTVTSGFWDVVAGPEAGLTASIFASPNDPNVVLSPSGYFAYDDQFAPASAQIVDYWGLLFSSGTSPSEINLFSDSPTQYEEYFNNGADVLGQLSVRQASAAIPQNQSPDEVPDAPSTSLLLGMAGVAVFSVRKLVMK